MFRCMAKVIQGAQISWDCFNLHPEYKSPRFLPGADLSVHILFIRYFPDLLGPPLDFCAACLGGLDNISTIFCAEALVGSTSNTFCI